LWWRSPRRWSVPYEWVEEGKGFRESLVPADIVNVDSRTVIREWPHLLSSKRGSMTDQTKATGTLKLIREASEAKLQPRGVP
jgi:hypothetical protein